MSSPPVLPDQPAKARYATPFVPAAIEEGSATNEARYAGGTSICTLGLQYGAAGAAAAGGVRNANNETARRAVTIPIGTIRRTRDARRSGALDIVGAPEAPAVLAGLFNRLEPGIEIENKKREPGETASRSIRAPSIAGSDSFIPLRALPT